MQPLLYSAIGKSSISKKKVTLFIGGKCNFTQIDFFQNPSHFLVHSAMPVILTRSIGLESFRSFRAVYSTGLPALQL